MTIPRMTPPPQRRLAPPPNPSNVTGNTRKLLTWLGIAVSFVVVDWTSAQQVHRLFRQHRIPHAGLLAEIVTWRIRYRHRHWRIRCTYGVYLFAWLGIGVLLWWLVGDWLGGLWMGIIGAWHVWVITSIFHFVWVKTDRTSRS